MRLTLLTQYYLPETGAPQNRLSSLAEHLQELGWDITVVTAVPNYPRNELYPGYQNRYQEEKINGITVKRAPIWISKGKGVTARLLNYFSFVFSSFFTCMKGPAPDILFLESPPLFLGFTALLVKRLRGCKLIVNISDLWPESAIKLDIIRNKSMIRAATWLEERLYRKADLISGQTQGIIANIKTRFPKQQYYWLPNGFDLRRLDQIPNINWEQVLPRNWEKPSVLYAGVLGYAQGLEVITSAAALSPEIDWILAGDGPEKSVLEGIVHEKGLKNVYFSGNIPGNHILSLIKACSAYVVPLRKLDLFKGAIPSKLFEPLALGKPVFLGVEGEALELFHTQGRCVIPFEPENSEELARLSILTLMKRELNFEETAARGPAYVGKLFNRLEIAGSFDHLIRNSLTN